MERTITLDSPRGRSSCAWWVTSPLASGWVRMALGTSINGMLLAGVGACWLQAVPLASSSKKQVTVRSVVIRSP